MFLELFFGSMSFASFGLTLHDGEINGSTLFENCIYIYAKQSLLCMDIRDQDSSKSLWLKFRSRCDTLTFSLQ